MLKVIIFVKLHSHTLQVWHVDTNDLNLLDNVETNWKGVQDLAIQKDCYNEEQNLIGMGVTTTSFGLWCCPLKTVNRDPNISCEKFKQMLRRIEQKIKPVVSQSLALERLSSEGERPQSKRRSLEGPPSRPRANSKHVSTPSQKKDKFKNVDVSQSQGIPSNRSTTSTADSIQNLRPVHVLHKDTDVIQSRLHQDENLDPKPYGIFFNVLNMYRSLRKSSFRAQSDNQRDKMVPEKDTTNKKTSVLSRLRDNFKREKIDKREPLKEQDMNIQEILSGKMQINKISPSQAKPTPSSLKGKITEEDKKQSFNMISEVYRHFFLYAYI